MTESVGQHLERVREYYERANPIIARYVGNTYQAGLVRTGGDDSPSASNRALALRAGVRPGERILDAGCGLGGPAIDIAQAFPGVTVEGITLSPAQAETARRAVQESGLGERIHIHVGDYHQPPFEQESFDRVLFLECTTYSYDLVRLFSQVFGVLRPGGTVYVKDVFLKEGALTPQEQTEIRDFDQMFKLYRTYPMSEGARALAQAGFADVECQSLDAIMTSDRFMKAMFELDKRGQPALNEFGQLHFRAYQCLPTVYGELRARRPERAHD